MAWYKREDSDEDLAEEKRSVPAGVFTKCPGCRAALLTADLEQEPCTSARSATTTSRCPRRGAWS